MTMTSSFSIIGMRLENTRKAEARQPSPRQTQQDREGARAQSRQDIADGRRMFLEQQARQAAEADPEAAYLAHCKAQALKICNAGRRARGLPLLTRLAQDESPEYPDQFHTPDESPDEGDDRPVDDKKRKGKKKAKDKNEEDREENENEGADDQPGSEEDEDEAEKRRNKAAALLIINAGRRRRGQRPLTMSEMQ
jgi:hypothetical protein